MLVLGGAFALTIFAYLTVESGGAGELGATAPTRIAPRSPGTKIRWR